MQYYSTNHLSDRVSFREAILHSEAPDGGLYMPERLPELPKAFVKNMADMSINDISFVVTNMLFGQDMPSHVLKNIADQLFAMPLKRIEPGIYVMELFHGPTGTVKDIGAGFLARVLKSSHEIYNSARQTLNVLISTNGNSGNAVANVFGNTPGVNVFALYPRDLSEHQHLHRFDSYGDNIHPICVNGHLDNCVNMISRVSLDPELEHMAFTSATSYNIGHLLPYIIVYFNAMAQIRKADERCGDVYMSIPTGSGGNLCAAYMAQKMGMGASGLVAACSANSALPGMMERGLECHRDTSSRSLAYSLDTPRTANLPRLLELCEGDLHRLRSAVTADTCTDPEIVDTIKDVYSRTGYILDPHSAVAYGCLKKQLPARASGIFFATSNPVRSADMIRRTLGADVLKHATATHRRPQRSRVMIPPTYSALKKYLKYNITA